MPLPFALDHINLWLLAEDDGWTLVDCGIGNAATRALWTTHFSSTMRGLPLRRIVATHCHPDHIGNAEWLATRFGCRVTMSLGEFLAAHALIDGRAAHSPAATLALFRMHGMSDADVAALAQRGNHYASLVPAAPADFDRVIPGDTVAASGTTWSTIFGYGHSSEHVALHCAERRVLISGDMLLPRISTNVSVWPSDPDGDPLGRFLASIAAFLPLPADTLVLPSHGLPFRGIALRVAQLRAHHDARLAELEAAIAAAPNPVTAAQMMPVLFRRELDLQQRFFAIGEAIAHLNYLWHAGRLDRQARPDGALTFTHRAIAAA
jgi:glyoxylase-like metal-dependent hydrolase (beta-lactamase superfamily II)